MPSKSDSLSLAVGLTQTAVSPPTMRIEVANTSETETYTMLKWASPLDTLVLPLGLISVTVPAPSSSSSATAEFPIPRIMLKRAMPPPDDAFVTLAPGETESQEVVLRDPVVDMDKLATAAKEVSVDGGVATVGVQMVCGGDGDGDDEANGGVTVWRGKRKEDLTEEEILSLGIGAGDHGVGENAVVRWKAKSKVLSLRIEP